MKSRPSVKPYIQYSTYAQMAGCNGWYSDMPQLAYCSLRVMYWTRNRDSKTGEAITWASPIYADVKQYFEQANEIWNRSEACTRLKSTIESRRPKCNKIVVFALGELGAEFDRRWVLGNYWRNRSAGQHTLLLTLRDALASYHREEHNVVCYAQDPDYSDVDKWLLADNEIKVVDDPDGFLQVDDSSAVVSVAAEAPIKQVVSDIAYPSLIIWDKVIDSPPAEPHTSL